MHVTLMVERSCVQNVLVENPSGKRPLGRPRHRWEDNIKVDVQEISLGAWIGLIWVRIGTVDGLL